MQFMLPPTATNHRDRQSTTVGMLQLCTANTRNEKKKESTQTWVLCDYLSKFKPHKNQIALWEVSVWVYWTYNQICALDINARNNLNCKGMKLALLSSAAVMNQGELTIRQQRHTSIQNNAKYIGRQSNIVTIVKKIMNIL